MKKSVFLCLLVNAMLVVPDTNVVNLTPQTLTNAGFADVFLEL